jgi:hypothetical protein
MKNMLWKFQRRFLLWQGIKAIIIIGMNFLWVLLGPVASQVPIPGESTLPENVLEMQTLGSYHTSAKLEPLGVDPAVCVEEAL